MIVENKVGAGGRVGAQAVKKAPANGTTLLFAAAGQFTLQPHLYANLGYDPFADFVPISQAVKFDLGFAVSSKLPVRSIPELVAWLKAHPEQASYGSRRHGDAVARLVADHLQNGLAGDVKASYRPGVLLLAGSVRWRCWSSLLETVKTGANAATLRVSL